MEKYRITAARPRNAANHLNSEFKVYHRQQKPDGTWIWQYVGWQKIHAISDLIKAGNEVRTGKAEGTKMLDGAAVELELRIAKNDTKYKISDMPDS